MRAMLLRRQRSPLEESDVDTPLPRPDQVLLKVDACGVCRTDLHVIDGDLRDPKLPLVLGHQVVGTVIQGGSRFESGDRVGIPWLGWTCGTCPYCRSGRENLCDTARFTGYTLDGGYGEFAVGDERFSFAIPEAYSSVDAAPLLCAGLIGYRSLRMCGDAEKIGFYGFGSAAHILIQVAHHRGQRVFAFTRPGDRDSQEFARSLGAAWTGASDAYPGEELDAAIIFAPAGNLVPAALRAIRKGGVVVCAGIHMSEIPAFAYELLWGERAIRSVANLTRADGEEFFRLASEFRIEAEVQPYELSRANEALEDLRHGRIRGTAVLVL